jgi:hypothetical protein
LYNPAATGSIPSSATLGNWFTFATGTTGPVVTPTGTIEDPSLGFTAFGISITASSLGNPTVWNSLVQEITGTVPGQTYNLSFWIRSSGMGQHEFLWGVSNGYVSATNYSNIGASFVSESWTQITWQWTQAPLDRTYLNFGAYTFPGAVNTSTPDTYYIYNMELSGSQAITQPVARFVSGSVEIEQVLNLATYTNTAPKAGDLWFNGTNLMFMSGATSKSINWT